jgi:anaerobic ribonucleoside-triphosphate reductase activating protein
MYHDIRYEDTLNGPGFRTVIFVSGCSHHCNGCHNPETWDPNSGIKLTNKDRHDILNSLRDPYIDGITFSGGDPLYDSNILEVIEICKMIRNDDVAKNKSIWVYTGYTYEEILKRYSEILLFADVIVDGPFILEEKDDKYLFAGSRNQRLIDVKSSVKSHEVVLWKPKF